MLKSCERCRGRYYKASRSKHTEQSTEPPAQTSAEKWEDMFECLVQFVKDRKAEELKGASDKGKEGWEWDGNVPQPYTVRSHVTSLLVQFS
jgi:hypothetical protein